MNLLLPSSVIDYESIFESKSLIFYDKIGIEQWKINMCMQIYLCEILRFFREWINS